MRLLRLSFWLSGSGSSEPVKEGDGIHGLLAFGLEAFDDDEVAVGAFEHERGIAVVLSGRVANDVGDVDGVCVEDDASFAVEFVFWFREGLVGDDLSENFVGSV